MAFFILLFFCLVPMFASEDIPIDGDCKIDTDCTPANSICDPFFEVCKCKTDFVSSADKWECLEIINAIGESCKETPQCTQGNLGRESSCAVGDSGSQCLCVPTAVHIPEASNNQCMTKADIVGGSCTYPLQCTANLGDDAECTSEICSCRVDDSIPKFDKTKCLHKVENLDGTCEETGQCTLGIGANTVCMNRQCVCTTSAIPVDNKCYLEAGLGEDCLRNEQCEAKLGNLAECSKVFRCMCKEGIAIESADGVRCLKLATTLGESCEEQGQCLFGKPGSHSTCYRDPIVGTSTCQCTTDAIEIPGSDSCLPKANLVGDNCVIHDQCRANLGSLSRCEQNGICGCTPGSVQSEDKTRCLIGDILIGESCEDSNQCVDTAVCTTSGYCSCPTTTVPSSDHRKCLPVIDNLNQHCEEASQCQQGIPGEWSDCVEKYIGGRMDTVCDCKSEAITGPGSDECLRKALIVGDPCKSTDQCQVNLGLAQCIGGTCQCLTNTNPSADRTKCVPKSVLNQPCEDNGQCTHIPPVNSAGCLPIDPAYPRNGSVCSCNNGYSPAPGGQEMCIPLASHIGESCSIDNDLQCSALEGTLCDQLSKTCQCDPARDLIRNTRGTKCLLIAHSVGDACEETVQCHAANTDCVTANGTTVGKCSCLSGSFIESERNPGNCIRLASGLNDTCSENIQCTVSINELSECRYGYCRCGERFGEYAEKCYFRASLGGTCAVHEECQVGVSPFAICSLGRCNCGNGTIESERSCWEDKKLGDRCTTDKECLVAIDGFSFCNSAKMVCTCVGDVKPSQDLKTCSGMKGLSPLASLEYTAMIFMIMMQTIFL